MEYAIEINFLIDNELQHGYKVIIYDREKALKVYDKIRAAGDLE